MSGRTNARLWGNLPALGPFVVVNPEGQGRRLANYSWGYAGQIADLATMPSLLVRALPWLRVDRSRIYAFGGSMGGQETLLLVAKHPRLLAGAAAFDSVTDLARQYHNLAHLTCTGACQRQWVIPLGVALQQLARLEIGGTPEHLPAAYAARSPLAYPRKIASSCVPLQLWWSVADEVINQGQQSALLFREARRLNPRAPIQAFIGSWMHTKEMTAQSRLPLALATFDLLPAEYLETPPALEVIPPPDTTCSTAPDEPRSAEMLGQRRP